MKKTVYPTGNELRYVLKLEDEHRTAIISEGTAFCKGKYVVDFYYDGAPDFEWKRGAHGMACEICNTLNQAKSKAEYYVLKDRG